MKKSFSVALGEDYINTILSHIPSYFLSLFMVLISIAVRIESCKEISFFSGTWEGKKDYLLG